MTKVPTQNTKTTARATVNHAIKGQPNTGINNKESHPRTQTVGMTASIHRGFKKVTTKAGIAGK